MKWLLWNINCIIIGFRKKGLYLWKNDNIGNSSWAAKCNDSRIYLAQTRIKVFSRWVRRPPSLSDLKIVNADDTHAWVLPCPKLRLPLCLFHFVSVQNGTTLLQHLVIYGHATDVFKVLKISRAVDECNLRTLLHRCIHSSQLPDCTL